MHFDPYKLKPLAHDVQVVDVPEHVRHEESQIEHAPVSLIPSVTKKYPSLHL